MSLQTCLIIILRVIATPTTPKIMPPTIPPAHSQPVLLLRSPSTDTPDRYESAFSTAGYDPISVPVLETALTNVNELAQIILNGPDFEDDHLCRCCCNRRCFRCGYSGVVMTSARACEAWKAAVESIAASSNSDSSGDIGCRCPLSWSEIPFYVVGSSTASSLRSTFSSHHGHHHATNSVTPAPEMIRGEESGNGEELANFILRDLAGPCVDGDEGWGEKREKQLLLYLTGDKTRETLPSILAEGGMELRSVKVYETRGSLKFKENLERAVHSYHTGSANAGERRREWWIVFFAPSSAQFVTPVLEEYFTLPSHDTGSVTVDSDHDITTRQIAKLAAIGPTTLTFLCDTLRLRVFATAAKPSADSLLSAIRKADYH